MQPYPKVIDKENVVQAVAVISRLREQDISDRNTFNSVFVMGRKVNRVPSSSADVVATDRIGDINFDADFGYILIDDTGAAWRRWALASW